jgi:enoyl-CoA hydratase/carnithine racemase
VRWYRRVCDGNEVTFKSLLYTAVDGVGTITINRPDQRNALSWEVMRELGDAFAQAAADVDIRVVVLTGAGEKAFCAGADLTAVASNPSVVEQHDGRAAMPRLFNLIWSVGKPVIARVRGFALAGGFGLALACDMIIAADDAQFGTPEINVGMWPMMITVPMLRSMPTKIALELQMTGRRVSADEALRIGFVNRVVPVAELDEAVATLARDLAAKSPSIMKFGRDAFYAVVDQPADAALPYLQMGLGMVNATEDSKEGLRAFAEKRSPNYTGR